MIVRRLSSFLVVVAAAALLTACPSPPPAPNDSPTAPATSPAPTTTSLASDVAFVVTGTLQSPDTATEVGFRLAVGAPVTGDADDIATFAASVYCPPASLGSFSTTTFVHLAFESELLSGDPTGSEVLISASLAPQDWQGDVRPFQASCADPLASPIPGVATGLAMVDSTAEVGSLNWIPESGGYGLSAYDVDPATMEPTSWTVTSCAIEYGPASVGTIAATLVRVDAAFSCAYGLRGR